MWFVEDPDSGLLKMRAVVEGRYLWGLGFLVAYAVAKNVAFGFVMAVVHRDALPQRLAAWTPELAAAPAPEQAEALL